MMVPMRFCSFSDLDEIAATRPFKGTLSEAMAMLCAILPRGRCGILRRAMICR